VGTRPLEPIQPSLPAAVSARGVQPPAPSWGGMLSDGRNYLADAWWLATFPGLAISLTVLAANVTGDWVRDLLDPRRGHSSRL
jgi:peptide/nickel transport system permease protein